MLRAWRQIDRSQKVVGENRYGAWVIQCCLLLGQLYHQLLRQATGLVASLLAMLASKDAVVHQGTKKKPLPAYLQPRNQAVAFMKERGSKAWKQKAAYHRRSLSELAMFRYQNTFSAQRRARKIESQQTAVELKCKI